MKERCCDRARRRTLRGLCGVVLTALAGLATSAVVLAQLSDLEQEAVDTYRTAMRAVESRATPGGLEAAFYLLSPVREALIRPRDSRWTLVESLTADDYQRLRSELPGVIVTRDKIVFAGPDPDYFVKLAETVGDPADRAFFAAFKATYPSAVWPAYLEQRIGSVGCTRFGSGTLVGTHRMWTEFQAKFPDRYVSPARREVESVDNALVQSTCACGDASSVVQELEAFVQAYPASSIRVRLLERAQAVRVGRSDIRTSCTAG